jgi:hypothetical protein
MNLNVLKKFFKIPIFSKVLTGEKCINEFRKLSSLQIQNALGHQNPFWMSLAINQTSYRESPLSKELVITQEEKDQQFIVLSETNVDTSLKAKFHNSPPFEGVVVDRKNIVQLKELFQNHFDLLLKNEIDFFQKNLNSGDFNPIHIATEAKALEWTKVSFMVLEKGIIESLTNPDYLFQTTFFCGKNPQTLKREFRLITFNLDMTFILLEDSKLRIIIYNKTPDSESKGSLKPSLMGDYSYYRRELFDQFVNLLGLIHQGLKA